MNDLASRQEKYLKKDVYRRIQMEITSYVSWFMSLARWQQIESLYEDEQEQGYIDIRFTNWRDDLKNMKFREDNCNVWNWKIKN